MIAEETVKMRDEIKTEEGIARFGGKRDRYFTFLKKFAGGLADSMPAFADAMSDEQKDATAHTVHDMKGMAGNLGATSLYSAAVEFEKTYRAGAPDESLYAELDECLKATKAKILNTEWA